MFSPYICVCVGEICCNIIALGLFVLTAICMGVTSVLGSLLGGILMKRFKITPLGSAKLFVVCIIVGVVGTLIEMGVGCDKPNMAGTLDTNGM